MAPELKLSPNPTEPETWVTVSGTGFQRSATRVLVDAKTVGLDSFKPNASNAFSIGFQSRTLVGTQLVEAQQKRSGKWTTIANASLVVAYATPPPPTQTVPGAPTNFVAVPGDTTASLSWTAPANDGGSPITGYTITGIPGPVTKTSTTTSISWSGLVNGTTYTFTVAAVNAKGTGPTATTTVTPQGTVTPPPSGTYTPSGPISVSSSNVTIEWKEISSNNDDSSGISIQGASATNRIQNITIRNCKITGFHSNFLVRFADNVTLEDCWIPKGFYCGFNIFSSNNVKIIRPRVDEIIHTMPNPQGNNAYGVKVDTLNSGDPVCDGVEVSDGKFGSSLLWMNLNAHSGNNINFLRNELHKAPRSIFVTKVTNSKIVGNKVLEPATTSGGTTNVIGIAYGSVNGLVIDQNQIDSAYPGTGIENIDAYVDGPNTSKNVTIGSNPRV